MAPRGSSKKGGSGSTPESEGTPPLAPAIPADGPDAEARSGPDAGTRSAPGTHAPPYTNAELQEHARSAEDDFELHPETALAGAAIRLDRSARKLVKATNRVAHTLSVSPALASTERAVTLRRTEMGKHPLEVLWWAINLHTDAISFERYSAFLQRALDPVDVQIKAGSGGGADDSDADLVALEDRVLIRKHKPHLPGSELYAYLKEATEAFLLFNCGYTPDALMTLSPGAIDETVNRLGTGVVTEADAEDRVTRFLGKGSNNYLTTVMANVYDDPQAVLDPARSSPPIPFPVVSASRMDVPCMLELIWNYWMEEGMLNQTVAAITRRFQNVRRAGPGPDPLAELELDPLRPLNGFIWGYLQDEPSRLSVVRRAYEYNHHYGLTLYGRAIPRLRPADSRVHFLEAFHNLLREAAAFYKEDNDTTVIADAFPVLNSLREVHLLLSEGAHNQFRDLPWQARAEMLLQQWLLARPEMREFLRGRLMVAYPEPWMGAVDSMKRLQGWTDTSVRWFRDLAVYGERILLSIRYGNWSDVNNQDDARAWLRYWKPEIQGYVHAYHTATGVNLSDEVVEVRRRADPRYLQPSWHLRNRLLAGQRALRQPL